jgi:hypothetical protein
LQDRGDSPRPHGSRKGLEGGISCPGRDDTSNIPATVVHGSDGGSLSGIGKLSDEKRGSICRKAEADSDYERHIRQCIKMFKRESIPMIREAIKWATPVDMACSTTPPHMMSEPKASALRRPRPSLASGAIGRP